ncbi:unnamed protein product, partial [Oppiella nova]
HVIATTRQSSHPELDQLRDKHPNRLHVLQLEGTNYNSFPGFVKQVEAIVGDQGLDTVINNAGILLDKRLDSVTAEDMLKNFEVNSVAPLMLTKALLPLLKVSAQSKRQTTLANISTILSSITNIHNMKAYMFYPYSASKAALNMITKCLSVDLGPENIRVLSIHPGHVQTDMGGPNAGITVNTSVQGILNVIKNTSDEDLGKLITMSFETVLITESANRGIGLSLVRQVLTTTHAKHVIATTRQSSHP